MSYQPFLPKPFNRWTLFLLAVLAFLAFAVMWTGKSMRTNAQAAGNSEFLALQPGQIAKIFLEVTAIPSDQQLTGKLLEKQNETRCIRTSTEVDVSLDTHTPIMMGSRSDVRSGAILHITGIVEENHALRASQVVVLTEYVTLSR